MSWAVRRPGGRKSRHGTCAHRSRWDRAFSPYEHFSVIVAQELRAGVRWPGDRKTLERNVLKVFERANRTITPSPDSWRRSGDVLAEMARQEGLDIARVSKAFANDVLLALRAWRVLRVGPQVVARMGTSSHRRNRLRLGGLRRDDDARITARVSWT